MPAHASASRWHRPAAKCRGSRQRPGWTIAPARAERRRAPRIRAADNHAREHEVRALAQAINSTQATEPNSSQRVRSVVGPITRSTSGSVGDAEARVGRRDTDRASVRLSHRSLPAPTLSLPKTKDAPARSSPSARRLPALPARAEEERLPDLHVRRGKLESRRHHADDLDPRPIELNRLSDDARVGRRIAPAKDRGR